MHFANVAIRVKSELAELHGERPGVLQGVTVRNRGLGATELLPARHVFMFIGAELFARATSEMPKSIASSRIGLDQASS
jgi:hypothetical protein